MHPEPLLYPELCHCLVGAAMRVLNKLRPGLDEKAYENALAIELRRRGHQVDQQKRYDIYYEGERVDTFIPDLIIDGKIIADPKVT